MSPDPIAYGPTGYRCGCGKDAHSNLTPCAPDPEIPDIPVRSQNSDGSWGVEMITRSEWERRRPKEMDE